jgi:hypothetical protein
MDCLAIAPGGIDHGLPPTIIAPAAAAHAFAATVAK